MRFIQCTDRRIRTAFEAAALTAKIEGILWREEILCCGGLGELKSLNAHPLAAQFIALTWRNSVAARRAINCAATKKCGHVTGKLMRMRRGNHTLKSTVLWRAISERNGTLLFIIGDLITM